MRSDQAALTVEHLEQLVRGELDLLVAPFGRTEVAGDDPGSMDPAQVPEHERVARLGLVVGALGEAEVPVGVLVPRVRPQEAVLVIGGGLGLAAAIAISRLLGNLLYGVTPADPISVAGAIVALMLVTAAAVLLPARRAARVDPVVALRAE